MQLKWKILFGAGIVFIGIQFFQPERNISGEVSNHHIEKLYAVPHEVKIILQQSCYDCHSNSTRYPWHSRIQPGAWFMAKHIREGKEELNFSIFGEYSARKQRNKWEAMAGQIKDDEMPLKSYTFIHQNAKLTPNEKEILMKWSEKMQGELE